jgi:hypothetical protein
MTSSTSGSDDCVGITWSPLGDHYGVATGGCKKGFTDKWNYCQETGLSFIKYAGTYTLGDSNSGFQIGLTRKPSWFHRFFMRICLGWNWEDTK